MWVEAIVAKDDLAKIVSELFPLRINVGQDGSVSLSDPQGLELVPDVGLMMTVATEVHWPMLGTTLPVSIRSATLEVRPMIVNTEGRDVLTLKLRLDEMDVSVLPAFVDRRIVELVNKELESRHVELSWGFTETLSHVFKLPAAMASAAALGLEATGGRVKVTHEALGLAVQFEARIEARDPGGGTPDAEPGSAPAPSPAPPSTTGSTLRPGTNGVRAGLMAALATAFLAGIGIYVIRARRRRPLSRFL